MGCKLIFAFSKSHFPSNQSSRLLQAEVGGERHLELCPRCCFKQSERFVVDRLHCWRELWRQSGEKASAAELLPPPSRGHRSQSRVPKGFSLLKNLLLQLKIHILAPNCPAYSSRCERVSCFCVSQNFGKSPAQLFCALFPSGR